MKLSAARDPTDAFERFVFVDANGGVRELYERECAYLATLFEGADGDRPYVKARYESRTPDGHSMHGFLERRHLPRGAKVELRPDPERFTRPRRFARVRMIRDQTILPLLVAAATGYAALIVGAFTATSFMHPGWRGLGIVLFVVAAFLGLLLYLLVGIIPVILSSDRWRFIRFFSLTAGLLGFFGGAAWVLWLHGDASRILLFR